jgi:hypothetical protein
VLLGDPLGGERASQDLRMEPVAVGDPDMIVAATEEAEEMLGDAMPSRRIADPVPVG